MKILFCFLPLLFARPALATPFAGCSGDHHGTYIDFVMEKNQVFIISSSDSDSVDELPPKKWSLRKVLKGGKPLQPKAYSWAIRQAIEANAKEEYYGLVLIEAKRGSETLYVNLNKYKMEHFVVVNGYVEALECPVESITE